jgi:hypothetical protein
MENMKPMAIQLPEETILPKRECAMPLSFGKYSAGERLPQAA